jgi:hypothetical protein
MIPKIKSVRVEREYKLIVEYEDGKTKVLDFEKLFNRNLFLSLKEKEIFSTARVVFDTVEWNNGIDIDPEDLFEEAEEINISKSA